MLFWKKKVKNEGKTIIYKHTGGLYGLGFVGAAIYYISTASGFWGVVIGILKALVWPAYLVYEALKFFTY
ncbi:MAG: hypothetical protein MUF61_03540 [archaeon]|nr:hypothetical protein [archaeon]